MFRLLIEFTSNRDKCGRLALLDESGAKICGPFAVAGRASSRLAAENGNPGRDPLFRYGDTPVGGYAVRRFERSGPGTQFPSAQFGTYGVIIMEGVSGEAACAEANGRFHILLCGGKSSSSGLLRSTAGALRLSNEDQRALCAILKKSQNVHCEIVERKKLPGRGAVFDDPACEQRDPPSLAVRESRPRHLSRELLRGGAAGAMMFSFTVSFVALQGATPAQAAQPAAAQSATASRREIAKMPPPSALPARPYVRMAYNTGGAAHGAMQQLQNAIGQPTGKTFDNSNNAQPSDATPSGGTSVPAAQPVPASEPPVTPQQQQMLDNDRQYQQYEQQLSNAQKASADAAAHEQQIQNQINTTTDSAARAQLQVDLAKARQEQSNADSTAAAAKVNAQERKKTVIQGAPIKQD